MGPTMQPLRGITLKLISIGVFLLSVLWDPINSLWR